MVEKFDYVQSQVDADELLQEFGQPCAIRRITTTPGENDWDPPTTVPVDYAVTVAVLPIALKDVDGTLVKAGDQRALISAKRLGVVPTTTDLLLINGAFAGNEYQDGDPWTVSSLKPLAPAGMAVLYDAVLTR